MPVPGAAGIGSVAVGGAAAEKSPTGTHWGQGRRAGDIARRPFPRSRETATALLGPSAPPSRAQAMEKRHLSGEKRRLSACLVCRMCCIG